MHEDLHKGHDEQGEHNGRRSHGGGIGRRRWCGARAQRGGLAALGVGAGAVGVALQDGGGLARLAQAAVGSKGSETMFTAM